MSKQLAKYISKKVLGETITNNFGQSDPYFETVPATRLDGRPSKKGKKRRKALPPGISEHDAKVLTKVKRRAYRLDMAFNFCGIRAGWSSVIGIFPVAGDAIDAFMAMMVLRTCRQVEGGLPSYVLMGMMFNICLDFGVGLIPILGDIIDVFYRCNTRNAVLLEKHLRSKGAKILKAAGQRTPSIDPTDPHHFDQQMREELGPPPQYSAVNNATGQSTHAQQSQILEKKGGGWFSAFGSKKKQADVERGEDLRRNDIVDSNITDPRQNKTLQKNRY